MRKLATYLLISLALASVVGCIVDPAQPRAHHPATTAASGDVRLSDAKPMDDLQSDEVQVNLTDKLEPPLVNETVYFGEADQFDSDEDKTPAAAMPLIAIKAGPVWKAVPLTGYGLTDAGWKYVGAGPAPHEVWGVLDTSAGDTRPNFVIAHSTDGAQTFKLQVFRKPCKLATVSDFAMSRSGVGRVTLSLDTDCGSNKAGLYHYATTDHGKTWSKPPKFEPDAMIRSDPVPDEEQPDQADVPSRTLFKAAVHSTDSR